MAPLKRFTAIILICLCFPALCSCAGQGKSARIYVSLESMPATLDPQVASSDSELIVARNIYEGLFRQNAKGEIQKAACKEYDYSGLVYTFTLRDDLKWADGQPIVADDFAFGIKRALSPETKAPFARLLYSIKGAKEVNAGTSGAEALGITVIDSQTLKIELIRDDQDFLATLSRPVSMPCREEFFNDSIGKYGLERDCVLSCGSYRLARWNKADGAIRLYVNEEYTGAFKPENGGVFIAKDKEKTVSEKLISGKSDMAVLSPEYLPDIKGKKIKTASVQNICWVLSLGGNLSRNTRRALCTCFSAGVYKGDLPDGVTAADTFFPGCLKVGKTVKKAGYYNPSAAQKLISEEIREQKSKKFPQTVLEYSGGDCMRPAITKIVGNWQKYLSAFINIKATDKSLENELKEHSRSLAIFPVKADSTLAEYLYKFGLNTGGDIDAAEKYISEKYNLLPVAFEDTTVGYLSNISGVYINAFGGYIDFSYVIKK